MKKCFSLFLLFILLTVLAGCSRPVTDSQIIATTGPVYQFTKALCSGTDLSVSQLITDNVSCLHDYTLRVDQMQAAESAEMLVLSGAGLEDFMSDILAGTETVIDASTGIRVMSYGEDHSHDHDHDQEHHHEHDPHIWLSPDNTKIMAANICDGLSRRYPAWSGTFRSNLTGLLAKLDQLQTYGENTLRDLSCRELITFHDGFAYFAHSFHLEILEAVEEESGSEASAKVLKHLIETVWEHDLPAVFTERNGSESAAYVIARETGAEVYQLDMAMSGEDYFASMYSNIDAVKEALE